MGLKVASAALLAALVFVVVSAASAATVQIAFLRDGELYVVQRHVPAEAANAEGAVAALVVGPKADEQVQGIYSAIAGGTMILAMRETADKFFIDFSREIISPDFGEAQLFWIYKQLTWTLRLNGVNKDVEMTANGAKLYTYLPPIPVITPRKQPVGGEPTFGSLSGRSITLSPGHGLVWTGSTWGFQRGNYCASVGLNREDLHNLEMCQYLEQYLLADGMTVKMCRCTNKNYGNHSSGYPWWQMASCYWMQNLGYPCSVYGSSTGCTLGSGSSEINDDIRARPLSSDYDATDIFISLHTNGYRGDCTGSCPTGTDTYYDCSAEHASWCTVSRNLDSAVHSALIDTIRNKIPVSNWVDRGSHDSDGAYGEIRIPDRAAVLIELAFHDTCDRDAIYLADNFFRSAAMWGIYKGICNYFGTTPTWDFYSDELVSHDIPSTMSPGQVVTARITFRNRGVLWNSAKGFRLGAVGDSDPFTTTIRYAPASEVGPGSTCTFTLTLTAPGTPGTYVTDWRMLREGYQWFGATCSQTVNVTGTAPPSIIQHPSNQSVCAGATATFTVTASGSSPLSYQWRKGTANITNGGHYSGATTSTLTVSNCDSSDAATNYNCYVSNAYGSATSNNASLTVVERLPAPTAEPASGITTETITWNWGTVSGATGYKLWTTPSGGSQIGGTITTDYYTETGLLPGTSYTRYVETWNACGASATRTQLGPTSTTARNCPENGDFEGGFYGSSPTQLPNRWTKLPDDGTSTFTQDTVTKYAGTSSQKIQDPTGGQAYTGWVYQKINVVPNRKYVLRFYSYRATGFVVGMGVDVNGGTSLVSAGESSTPGSWVLKTSPTPFTSGTSGIITVGYRGGQNLGDTTGWIDNMSILPAKPDTTGGATTICSGQSATITASGGFGGNSSELHWYTGPGGTGTYAGTGTSLTVSPTVTTTYYPRWEVSGCTGCCFSDDGSAVTITVNPLPPAPSSPSANPSMIYPGGSSTLTATVGSGVTVDWYTGSCGGTLVGSGASLVVSPGSTTTYYPRARNTTTGCVSSSCGTAVTVTVLQPAPTVTSITPCSGPNTGTTSVTNLAGANFVSGAAVKLRRTGYSDISATGVTVQSPTRITCLVDLTAKKTGLWDVVVTNPDAQSGILANGFGIGISDSKPIVGTTIRSLAGSHPELVQGSLNFRFRVWGVVEIIDASTFWLDDGSGTRIKVFAPGYAGISTGSYASAAGTADVSLVPPVLVSSSDRVVGVR